MSVRARQLLIAVLVLVFFGQTWLVYTDPAGRSTAALSEQASRGREIWHRHNCQSCHQLYGFGGFLGPDLTNAHERLTTARLETVLTVGAKQMPAFDLDAEERAAMAQFLAEVHETGIGQLPPLQTFDAVDVLARSMDAVVADGTPLGPEEQRGYEVMLEQKCIGCHLPNPAAQERGTDLTTLIGKLGPDGTRAILRAGIPAKGMPKIELAVADEDALVAFLQWLAASGEPIRLDFLMAAPAADAPAGLPWWEYE